MLGPDKYFRNSVLVIYILCFVIHFLQTEHVRLLQKHITHMLHSKHIVFR